MPKFCALASLLALASGGLALACGGNDGASTLIDVGPPKAGASGGATGASGAQGQGGSISVSVGTGGGTGIPGAAGTTSVTTSTVDQLKGSSCAGWSAEPEGLPAVLEFVVDVSGSMDEETPATNGQTKWEVTSVALRNALDELPGTVGLGMLFYPNTQTRGSTQAQPVTACVNTNALIPLEPLGAAGSMHRTRLSTAIAAMEPNSLTPTHDAYDYALNQGLLPTMVPGRRFMVLLTDGAPTLDLHCIGSGGGGGGGGGQFKGATQPIIDQIQLARTQGVSTFVLGAPGSEEAIGGGDARPWLSAAARAGGTETPGCVDTGPNFCHMDLSQAPDFAAALQQSLGSIAGAVVSCEYDLPAAPAGQSLDLNTINVIHTAANGTQQLLGRSMDPACTEGWTLSGNQVRLCSATCTQVKADDRASLQLLFGCASVPSIR